MQLEPEEKTFSRSKQNSGKKPASRWRNKYWSPVQCVFIERTEEAGEHFGKGSHPSRDVAETVAAEWLAQVGVRIYPYVKYLGAFPIDGE
jgi:hypothetical protein